MMIIALKVTEGNGKVTERVTVKIVDMYIYIYILYIFVTLLPHIHLAGT